MLDAVDRSMDPGFTVDIEGGGSQEIGAIAIDDGFGTIALSGESMNAFAYERIPWPDFEYIVYQALAVQEDEWTIYWFYCQEGNLQWVYYESTHGVPLQVEEANGRCEDGAAEAVAVEFPATNMSFPLAVANQTINGSEIQYGNGSGWLVTGDRNWTMFPFLTVDCTTECGSPGWTELHVVLWNQTDQRAVFGILYLRSDAPEEVSLLYSLRVPSLVRMSDTFEATWTT